MHATEHAHIRRLCCLNMEWRAVVPDLLKALDDAIPSGPNVFLALKPDLAHDYVITQGCPTELMQHYLREIQRDFQLEIRLTKDFATSLAPGAYFDYEERAVPGFYRTSLYQEIWRPLGQHHSLLGLLHQDGHLRGAVRLFRGEKDRRFTRGDARALEQLLPHIAHGFGLDADATSTHPLIPTGRQGHILVNASGQVTHLCDTMRGILDEERVQWLNGGNSAPIWRERLSGMCRNLRHIQHGADAPPPVFFTDYPGGRLVFKAHVLHADRSDPEALTLVSVAQFEREPLLLMRGLRTLPLSIKESEVCLWLAQGLTTADVARRMGIRPNTVKAYADSAYVKLDLHNRSELRQRILRQACAGHDNGQAPAH